MVINKIPMQILKKAHIMDHPNTTNEAQLPVWRAGVSDGPINS